MVEANENNPLHHTNAFNNVKCVHRGVANRSGEIGIAEMQGE